ncbi:MAG: hypothetical protein K0R13_2973 [Propionibacteriaceae bacterium]|jgi:hypothetical protein|nr:hypothetical protein [Propionibacteriaceae bacterium]
MTKFSAGTCRLSHHAHKSTGAVSQRGHFTVLVSAPGVGRRRDAMTASVEILEEAARQLTRRQAEFLRLGPTFGLDVI